MKAGLPPGYDGRCRDLTTPSAGDARGRGPAALAAVPHARRRASARFTDLVRGEVSVEWSTISDFVIVRSDGTPLFFLANAVDDARRWSITHVIRGEDLIDTTHRVLALRAGARAHGADADVRAPAADPRRPIAAKLSKRHGSVAVEDFRDRGYLAEALLNYLALLGWAPDDEREVLTRDEIVADVRPRAGHATRPRSSTRRSSSG